MRRSERDEHVALPFAGRPRAGTLLRLELEVDLVEPDLLREPVAPVVPRLASSLERLGGKRDARHEHVGRAAVRVPDRLGRGSVPADLYRVVFGPQGTLTD